MCAPSEQMLELAVRSCGAFRWNGFLADDQLRRIQISCATLLAGAAVEVQSRSFRVWNLFAHGAEFRDLLLDNRLANACSTLLGPGYVLSDYSLNSVYPGARQDPWHVDYPYNEAHERVSSAAPLGLQCILAIDDFDEGNGATQFIPLSHTADHDAAMGQGVATAGSSLRRFDGRPGDLLVMHAGTQHRAGLNTTAAPRTGIVLSFVQRWVRPIIAPRDVAASLGKDTPEELRVLLGAVVYEEIDTRRVRREVL